MGIDSYKHCYIDSILKHIFSMLSQHKGRNLGHTDNKFDWKRHLVDSLIRIENFTKSKLVRKLDICLRMCRCCKWLDNLCILEMMEK